MTRQEIKQFSKLQNQACGLVNRLRDNKSITSNKATDYVMQILNYAFEIEHIQAIIDELKVI